MNHWAVEYILKFRHKLGGTGPIEYDCLNFFAHVQKEHFSAIVDLENIDAERLKWRKVEQPTEGSAVLMAYNNAAVHVGTWISANGTHGVLHCARKIGVAFTQPEALSRLGFRNLQYFSR